MSSISFEKMADQPEKKEPERASWGGKAEFLLTCIGSAVGLGNVWRFPYLAFKNGGGAFVLPYVVALLLIGLPVFFFELSFGQFASTGPFAIWTSVPIFKGVGYGMISVAWLVALSYNVILSWILYYLFSSMTNVLPWSNCLNTWNNLTTCVNSETLKNISIDPDPLNRILGERGLTNETEFTTPSEEFFFNEVLQLSGGIDQPDGIVWQLALCLLLVWMINFLVLIKGIASLGKVVYFATIFPYIMLTVMLVRGVTLTGASKGIFYYVNPDWDRLTDGEVWSDAATQIFYSLSACSGGLIAMASYNNFKNNCLRFFDCPFINCGTSFFAGFAIFSVLGFMAEEQNVPVSQVADEGPGLVFVVYPEGLTQMPIPALWSVLFFIMMTTLGFSSSFSILESIFTATLDEFPDYFRGNTRRSITFRAICCASFYLISLPMVTRGGYFLFNIVDTFVGGFPLLFIGLFELVAMQWVYGCRRYLDDVLMMLTGKRPRDLLYFVICWVGVTPAFIVFILFFKIFKYELKPLRGVPYPAWAEGIGWMVVVFTVMWIPLWAIIQSIRLRGVKNATKPQPSWGPALPENRTGRYAPPSSVTHDNLAFDRSSGSGSTHM